MINYVMEKELILEEEKAEFIEKYWGLYEKTSS